jgi:hypothetical protein
MSRRLTVAAALLAGASLGCLSTNITDNGAPVVVITSPSTDQVSGVVTIRATVVDDRGVDAVAFFIDDNKLVELRVEPFQYIWASTSVPDGNHLLKVTAKDINGNTTTATKLISVDNNPN